MEPAAGQIVPLLSRADPQSTASLKPIRNKTAVCYYCRKHPPQGRKWDMCKGCRLVVYCSRDCQLKHWASHKSVCRYQQRVREQPDLARRHKMVTDFITLHWTNWLDGVDRLLLKSQHDLGRAIDPELYAVIFGLCNRPDNNGNPAKAFRLSVMGILSRTRAREFIAQFEADKDAKARRRQAWRDRCGDDYVGELAAVFVAEGGFVSVQPMAIFRFTSQQEQDLATFGGNWLLQVADFVDLGIVGRQPAESDDEQNVTHGMMYKEGNKWKWRQAPDKQVHALMTAADLSKIALERQLDPFTVYELNNPRVSTGRKIRQLYQEILAS